MDLRELKEFLDAQYDLFNRQSFVEDDPVCVPHLFSKLQDREISGFFSAILAWGQRKTIIASAKRLMTAMDYHPYEFVSSAGPDELRSLGKFVHRTFNSTDLLYFIQFFRSHYSSNESLESAFLNGNTMEERLISFRKYFFSLEGFPDRTKKHVASPITGSSCKRLNMFLRWMVRKDERGVDFGIWKHIQPSELMCPLDIHVGRVARELGLLSRKRDDWNAVVELTENLRKLDPLDPVKYDFALFGTGLLSNRKD